MIVARRRMRYRLRPAARTGGVALPAVVLEVRGRTPCRSYVRAGLPSGFSHYVMNVSAADRAFRPKPMTCPVF